MRIVYLHQYFATPSMRGGTRSYEMARRLVRAGHDVQLITSFREEDPHWRWGWRGTSEDGIQVHWTPIPYSNRMTYSARLRAFWAFVWRSARQAVAVGGDLVFATSTPLTIALPGVYAARRLRVPMVLEIRDLWPEVPIAMGALQGYGQVTLSRGLERFAYRHAEHIVALSPDMQMGITARGVAPDRITVIPNGCDFDRFGDAESAGQELRKIHQWLRDRPMVLYAGTIGRLNGVEYLVRLAAELARRDPRVCIVVIGDGALREAVVDLARGSGVYECNFFVLPAVAKRAIPGWFAACDIAVSTVLDLQALWANSANKVFDAMAAGRAIAINHEGWLAALVREMDCGIVLNSHDYAAAASDLLGRLQDEPWLARAGAAARRLGRERFDRDVLAGRLNELCEGVVQRATGHTVLPRAQQ